MKKFTDKEIEELATEYVLNECSDCNDDLGYGFEAGFKKALELIEKDERTRNPARPD